MFLLWTPSSQIQSSCSVFSYVSPNWLRLDRYHSLSLPSRGTSKIECNHCFSSHFASGEEAAVSDQLLNIRHLTLGAESETVSKHPPRECSYSQIKHVLRLEEAEKFDRSNGSTMIATSRPCGNQFQISGRCSIFPWERFGDREESAPTVLWFPYWECHSRCQSRC